MLDKLIILSFNRHYDSLQFCRSFAGSLSPPSLCKVPTKTVTRTKNLFPGAVPHQDSFQGKSWPTFVRSFLSLPFNCHYAEPALFSFTQVYGRLVPTSPMSRCKPSFQSPNTNLPPLIVSLQSWPPGNESETTSADFSTVPRFACQISSK